MPQESHAEERRRVIEHVAASLFTLALHQVLLRMQQPMTYEYNSSRKKQDDEEEAIDEWWREDDRDGKQLQPCKESTTETSTPSQFEEPIPSAPSEADRQTPIARPYAEKRKFIWGLSDEDSIHFLLLKTTSNDDGQGDKEATFDEVQAEALDILHPVKGLLIKMYLSMGIMDKSRQCSLVLLPLSAQPCPSSDNRESIDGIEELARIHLSLLEDKQEGLMVVQSLLRAAICASRSGYDSRSRSSISLVAKWLDIPTASLRRLERTSWVLSLKQTDNSTNDDPFKLSIDQVAKDAAASEASSSHKGKFRSALAVGGIAVGAGALLAITGGLAAPFIAAGLGTLTGAITGSAVSGAAVATGAASVAGTGAISASLGVLGATSVGSKAHKQLRSDIEGPFGYVDLTVYEASSLFKRENEAEEPKRDFDLLQLPLNEDRSEDGAASVTICINGWIASPPSDFLTPWIRTRRGEGAEDRSNQQSGCPNSFDNRFALLWEEELLSKLGEAILRLVKSQIITQASNHILSMMAVGALLSALALPLGVLAAMRLALGDSWHLALRRSKEAGTRLAHHLIALSESSRSKPATLIGFSIGARVVFHALLELERQGKRGLVENAILIGSPVSSDALKWSQARSVVSGRLVNCHIERDWVLGVMFKVRSTEGLMGSGVAGISPVLVEGVENIGLGRLMGNEGHEGYTAEGRMEEILMDAVRLEC